MAKKHLKRNSAVLVKLWRKRYTPPVTISWGSKFLKNSVAERTKSYKILLMHGKLSYGGRMGKMRKGTSNYFTSPSISQILSKALHVHLSLSFPFSDQGIKRQRIALVL